MPASARSTPLVGLLAATLLLGSGSTAGAADDSPPAPVTVLSPTGVDDNALQTLPSPESVVPEEVPPGGGTRPPAAPPTDTSPDGTPAEPDVLTTQLVTAPFTVFGVTWDRARDLSDVVIRYRVRVAGAWSAWDAVAATEIAPDSGSADAEGTRRDGTDPLVAIDADGIQVWAEAASGKVRNLKVVLINPDESARPTSDVVAPASYSASAMSALATPTAAAAVSTPAQPVILTRADWGADESLRTCQPDYSMSMVSAAVHHTASSNAYSAADVPGLIRGFYAYHTRPESAGGRGWCDIGYNFLVDRFGRIWEGRAGGITSTVVGVHTGGFNSRTIGVAAIGDYSQQAPSAELVDGLVRLIAWKFAVHGITAGTSVTMTSGGGASKYPEGTTVVFPTIYGHRDAQLTACPGQYLYDLLPAIRTRVADLANASVQASPRGKIDYLGGTVNGVAVSGWAFDPETDQALRVDVSVDGVVTSTAATGSRPDVAAAFGIGDRHGIDAVIPTTGGRHVVCVTVANLGSGRDIVLGCTWLTAGNQVPFGSLDLAVGRPDGIVLGGWALDPDTDDPVGVHVYVDGTLAAVVSANADRPDVAAAYHRGAAHGFAVSIPAAAGAHQVCTYLINLPAGGNPLLACTVVNVVNNLPFGVLDVAAGTASTIDVGGWALDPDTNDPVDVHVYVDSQFATAVTANGSRPDVDAAYRRGPAHGFSATVAATTGRHRVCLYAINRPAGGNPLLACADVSVADRLPIGTLDLAVGGPSSIRVGGWALDPDATQPIAVHVYVDSGLAMAASANAPRPDVDAVYHLGPGHGFDVQVPAAPGGHRVCVYMIGLPAGANPLLACRAVTV